MGKTRSRKRKKDIFKFQVFHSFLFVTIAMILMANVDSASARRKKQKEQKGVESQIRVVDSNSVPISGK